jgi:protein-S-isoprenylcysteine O-methyltransferase Ste14
MTPTRGSGRQDAAGAIFVVVQVALIALLFGGPRHLGGAPAWPALVFRISPWLGAVLLAGGALLMGDALRRLGRRLSPLPRPVADAVLLDKGVFGLVRHPMYSGGVLLAFGWALSVRGGLTLLWAVLLTAWLDRKTRLEERLLLERFPAYADYRRRTRRLVPFIY